MGSRRTTPTLPVMAAVVSVPMAEPRNTPCAQSKASKTSHHKRGRTIAFGEARITDAAGRLLAVGRATYMILVPRGAPGS